MDLALSEFFRPNLEGRHFSKEPEMSITKRCSLLLRSLAWLAFVHGAAFVGSSSAFAGVILPQGTWSYWQSNSPGRLLDDQTLGGQINPMAFPTYMEDKTITYAPNYFWPSHEGGYTQTLASTVYAGGRFPSIFSEAETSYYNIPVERGAGISAHMEYDFQAWKKYDWSPEIEVPVAALMNISAYASGGNGTKAYASSTISAGSFSAEVSIFTELEGNGSKQLASKFLTRLDTANRAFLSTNILLVNNNAQHEPYGTWGGNAFADPLIEVDPDVFIDVGGISYRASDLYGLSFSPGFSAVPEPSGMGATGRPQPQVLAATADRDEIGGLSRKDSL
jgi:hypothetical protein